jgi:broad specificity phosphatase PhoE
MESHVMTDVLGSVDWGRAALDLLDHVDELEDDRPTVMHIRHTERQVINDISSGRAALSTPLGKQAAYELGLKLPLGWIYRFFHTYYERTQETAESIHGGITSRGGESEVVGDMKIKTILDQEEYFRYQSGFSDTDHSASDFMRRWTSGETPPHVILPSIEFAKRVADATMVNLRSAHGKPFHIYVSHDVWVAALMYHWFGVQPPDDWYTFLDGFIMQLGEEGMIVYYRDKERTVDYPEWWDR